MLKPHEIARAEDIIDGLERLGVALPGGGPYGRTITAMTTYRDAPLSGVEWARPLLAELICIYAVGIVRGDGEGIAADQHTSSDHVHWGNTP